ncbi:MAG: 4-hydroxythreonine-4-phosphate dehydrogenase PdxA [Candidatus Izemoplasmatales bacterium]|jgi:4-hydroxythreonine-4-phosphate dehydrogenase|nr:4-hydroxythreonine-4-phosphate dehydrogenase PdxA [Candidatus Izemoplasmatales bacterium]
MNKPIIGVPIGDPAGIGPEIAIKSAIDERVLAVSNPLLIGDVNVLKNIIDLYKLPVELKEVDDPRLVVFEKNVIYVYPVNNIDMNKLILGKVDAMCGQAAFEYIKASVDLSNKEFIKAIATTPINKESLKAANVPFIGHTEIYAALSDTHDPLTMFEIEKLRVFFLSRHVSLRKAIDMVKKERVMDYIKRSHEALERLGVKGTIAVAGLNPHSGEHGLFGWEEVEEIVPAIEEMQRQGYDVVGPVPADSIFAIGLSGKWAAILSLYHDQGHIATKTYDFHRTISITNGMPFLRTSVDHGTAMDIAGKNIANEISMSEAIILAAKYAPYFKKR